MPYGLKSCVDLVVAILTGPDGAAEHRRQRLLADLGRMVATVSLHYPTVVINLLEFYSDLEFAILIGIDGAASM